MITGALLSAAALGTAVYIAGEIYMRSDFSGKFTGMHEGLARVDSAPAGDIEGRELVSLDLTGGSGIEVEAFLTVPAGADRKLPAVIILGGLRTGRRTVEYLREVPGIAVLAMDYPYEGKREGLGTLEFIRAVPAIRRSILETVPAVMLGVDYLASREDIDEGKIILVGGSLGALFVPAAAGSDRRIDAAAILFGGCDIAALVRHGFDGPAWLGRVAGWAASALLAPVEPARWTGRISPRPVFILSAEGDELIPAACSRGLHEKAGEPRTIRWIDTGHLDIRSEEFHRVVVEMLLEWMESNRLVPDGG